MRTLKTVAVVGVLAVVVIGALALIMAGRGWWNAGAGTETTTPTTVTVTAEPDTTTETETEEPETKKTEVTEDTEAEVTETEDPEDTKEPEDTEDLGLKRDKETVESLSGQERTAVRGVLRDCMDQIGALHYVSQIKKCLADDMDGWSEDSARRSGETAY